MFAAKYFRWWPWLLLAAGTAAAAPAHKDPAFTQFFRQTDGWAAGDGAISIALPEGRVLWLFGDSYIDQFDSKTGTLPCLFNARNALMLQDKKDVLKWHTLRNPDGSKSFLHPPELKHREAWPCFWPGAGFQSGNLLYIYAFEMQQTGRGGMLGFTNIGQSWAKLSLPELKVVGYSPLPSFNGIAFWCGFINDKDGKFTYGFGSKQHGIASDVYVARLCTGDPEEPWAFWDGKGWNGNVAKAVPVAQGASFSVQVCQVAGKFLLTSTAFSVACDQGKEIYIAVSDSPTGPFSRRQAIFTVNDTVQGHYPFFYSAEAHPEFINAAQELLITYSINGYEPCVPTCVHGRMNPDYYRPRAIRLPLRFLQSPQFRTKESLRPAH